MGRRRRIDGTHLDVPPGLRITDVSEAGMYGLHVAFSADARGGVLSVADAGRAEPAPAGRRLHHPAA
ncbi:MAG: hypothetical protein WDN31_18850 [Hyphomicrobium sp.]